MAVGLLNGPIGQLSARLRGLGMAPVDCGRWVTLPRLALKLPYVCVPTEPTYI